MPRSDAFKLISQKTIKPKWLVQYFSESGDEVKLWICQVATRYHEQIAGLENTYLGGKRRLGSAVAACP